MKRMPGLRRLVDIASPDQVRRDVDDEIRFHLDSVTAELVATGMEPDDARREAERRFGHLETHRQQLEAAGNVSVSERLWRDRFGDFFADVRHSTRTLVREPLFTLGVVFTLGVGLAANTTMFGIVDRLLLKPPAHVRGGNDMSLVYLTTPERGGGTYTRTSTSWQDYVTLRDSTGTLAEAAAFWVTEASLGRGSEASKVRVGLSTANFFPLLGVQPLMGRFFDASEDDPAATDNVAVISHALWTGRFASDPQIVGRSMTIDQRTYIVVGVAPRGFNGPTARRADAWVPIRAVASDFVGSRWQDTRDMYWLKIVGRLTPGLDRSTARERASVVHQRANRAAQKGDSLAQVVFGSIVPARGAGIGVATGGIMSGQGGTSPQGRVATWLMGVAVVVLLIVCANTANLFLARHNRRSREIAVRLAIGVRRSRLIRSLLSEALLLAFAAAAVALVLAWWGTALMRSTLLAEYALDVPPVDGRVVGFTALAAVLTAVLAGLVPAVVASSHDLTSSLKSGTRGSGRRRTRLQRGLLVAQAGLSMLLLVGAGLFVRSLNNVATLRLGYDADRMLVANIEVSSRLTNASTFNQFWTEAVAAVRTIPGVEATSLGVTTPFATSWATDLFVPGHDSLPGDNDGYYVNAVSPSWFETVGTRIKQGRGFLPTDVKGAERVAVVNELMARILWPRESATGKCLKVGADTAPCTAVVGVMENSYRDNLRETPTPQYVVVLDQGTFDAGMRTLYIRTRGDPATMVPLVRERLQGLRPDLPFADVQPMRALMEGEVQQWRMGATMFGLFGIIALVVAAIGLYALVAYDVAQRWHELGVRAALGARPNHLRGIIVRAGVADAIIGLAAGAIVAAAVAPLAGDLLFGVPPRDAATFSVVAGLLFATAVVAALAPARRASRVVPADVLRAD